MMIHLLNEFKLTLDACHEMVEHMLNVAQNQGFVEVRWCSTDDQQLG